MEEYGEGHLIPLIGGGVVAVRGGAVDECGWCISGGSGSRYEAFHAYDPLNQRRLSLAEGWIGLKTAHLVQSTPSHVAQSSDPIGLSLLPLPRQLYLRCLSGDPAVFSWVRAFRHCCPLDVALQTGSHSAIIGRNTHAYQRSPRQPLH